MAHAVAAKGYADTTIADIVREASVSRRTFYEHFSTKAECLIALYEAASHNALKVLRDAIDPPARMADPGGARAVGLPRLHGSKPGADAHAVHRDPRASAPKASPRAAASTRRSPTSCWAWSMAAKPAASATPLPAGMAMAVVGGINELILQYIEQDRVAQLPELVEPASQLVRAVTEAAPDAMKKARDAGLSVECRALT